MTAQSSAAPQPAEAGVVARGSLVNVTAMATGAVLGFGLTVLASRWLQPRRTGEFFELIALFTILSNTLGLGADTGLTRWISRARAIGGLHEVRRVVLIALGPVLLVGLVIGAAVWLAAPALAHAFLHGMRQAQGAADVRLVAPLIPVGALSICLIAGARGFGRMWPYLWVEGLGKPALRIVLVTAALLAGWGLRGALVGWSLPVAIGMAASWIIFRGMIRREAPAAAGSLVTGAGRLAAAFWRFAAPRGLAAVFQVTALWIGILLVGVMLTSYDAGLYSAVSRLAMIGTLALEATRLAIAPQLSGLLARREHSRVRDLYQNATCWLMLASWPVYLLFAIFPTVALGIFGHKYLAGASALVVIALAMLVNTGTGNVTVVLLMGGKSYLNVVNTLLALAVNIGLNLVLLPRIGLVGAAVAWAASIVVDNLAAVAEVWFILSIEPVGPGYGLVVAITGGSFGLVGVGARALIGQTLPALASAVAVGLIVFCAAVYACRSRLHLTGLRPALRMRQDPAGSRDGQAPAQTVQRTAVRSGPGRHRLPPGQRRLARNSRAPGARRTAATENVPGQRRSGPSDGGSARRSA